MIHCSCQTNRRRMCDACRLRKQWRKAAKKQHAKLAKPKQLARQMDRTALAMTPPSTNRYAWGHGAFAVEMAEMWKVLPPRLREVAL